ncbi:HEAT repeat domain-containing protein [Thermoleptolyngbya sp. C42_A2020_037]|uniref:HEAT repeat domain-containing protein n=1 Tax=Thermoleptolyngbya sp. C42_A2020_037 TaxID=2747799 RepID=UPI0019FA8861|nr:HEAT repeat domain-containing protein [Thermoleptolyngbya sp. C42_A2020_037]MBF2084054.1 HEAT repeat domain-containing protein [Thermoleptolyngbya sp. C42_A2020_037]
MSTPLATLIADIDRADSPERLIAAVQALAAARLEEGIPTLIRALGFNNPGAAVMAVKGLVQMGEAAVMPLLTLLDDYNYGARAYAIRALAAIADPRALDVLVSAAETDFAPSVRRAATKGVGQLHWLKLADSERAIAQSRTYDTLVRILDDADWSIRYAAIAGLQALGQSAPDLQPQILETLRTLADSDIAVQARVQWAIATLQSPQPVPNSFPSSQTPIPNP